MSAYTPAVRGGFFVKPHEIVVEHKDNVRFEESYEKGDETPGSEQASLKAMAETMRRVGQLQPVIVRARADGRWTLIAGFRRYMAAQAAKLPEIFCAELVGSDVGVREAENVARKNLIPVEICLAVGNMAAKEKLSPTEIALRVGLSMASTKTYLFVATHVHPQIMNAWRRSPGAFQLADLARVGTMGPAEQVAWFAGKQMPTPSMKPPTPRERARRPSRKKLEERRKDVRAKKVFAHRSSDFREGYVEALSYALGDR